MAFLLHQQARGECSHHATAAPIAGNPRVKLGGQPVLTTLSQLAITACPNKLGSSPFPCLVAVYAAGATRVKVMGAPVLLDTSKPTNLPTAATTTIKTTQSRVKGI
jgi:hypothetical protein